jgi:hypothetical protein
MPPDSPSESEPLYRRTEDHQEAQPSHKYKPTSQPIGDGNDSGGDSMVTDSDLDHTDSGGSDSMSEDRDRSRPIRRSSKAKARYEVRPYIILYYDLHITNKSA